MKTTTSSFFKGMGSLFMLGMLILALTQVWGCGGGGGGDDDSDASSVSVPNVTGLTQAAAQSAIVNAGLTVGSVTSGYSDIVASGSVVSQNPAAGASVDEGSAVNLVVSSGPAPPPEQYSLNVSVTGSGSVTLDPPGGVYDEGSVVTLTAVPVQTAGGWDYDFTAWSGELNGSVNPATLTMDGNKSVTATFNLASGLLIKDSDYHGPDYRDTVWITASVRNAAGDYIPDLTVDDFQLTEYIVAKADNSIKAQAAIDLPAFDAGDDTLLGLAKTITGGQPLDLVFLLDASLSMAPFYADLRLQMTSLVDEMIANHVDFRLACHDFAQDVRWDHYFEFYGPQEVETLMQKIGDLTTRQDYESPTTAYDALLFSPWFGFREGARKVCVVVTDVLPMTAYMAYWPVPAPATRSAAEMYLLESGAELFYAQRENFEHEGLASYYDEDINPRAGEAASGFAALQDEAGSSLATRLSFPFDRQELKTVLGIDTPLTVTDSAYVLSWNSSFDRWDTVEDSALIYFPEDYELRVVLQVPDPDHAGEFLQATCTYPIDKEKVDMVLNAVGEEGTPPIDLSFDLSQKMGERGIRNSWGNLTATGQVSLFDLPAGTYNVTLRDSSFGEYTYHSLRAMYRETITVSEDGMVFDMTVPVGDRAAEIYKTRGLLKEIGEWRLPGDPFQTMVDNANAWLDTLLIDGLSWEEMDTIKRFYVGLSGFANAMEYAQQEAEKAIEDFDTIVQNFRDIVEEVNKIGQDTEADWAAEIASGAMEVLLALMGQVQFDAQKAALELAIQELLAYAADEITQELRDKVIEQFPLGDYSELLQKLINTLIDADFGDTVSQPDWDAVIEAVRTIALDKAIAVVQEKVGDAVGGIIETALQDLPLSGSLTEEVKTLVQTILTAFLNGDIQSDTFSTALETFANNLADDVISAGKDLVGNAVANSFDAVAEALADAGVDPDVSGLLVGMARDLTLQALPDNDNGSASFNIDTDAVVSVLIKYGVYYVILKDYCIDDLQEGLDALLAGAMGHVPAGDDRWDWVPAMESDFEDYTDIVRDLQASAWSALRIQEAINAWAEQMAHLCDLLDAISGPLDVIAAVYPDLQDTADDVHAFIAVLDGLQILANATSFGLKVDSLDTFGNQAQPMHQTLFY